MRLLSKEIAAPLGKDGKEVEIPRDSFRARREKYVGHACRLITRVRYHRGARGDFFDPLHI